MQRKKIIALWVRMISMLKPVLLMAVILFLWNAPANAAMTVGHDVRTSIDDKRTRLVFDLSGPVSYKKVVLTNPDRVVIDLNNADLSGSISNVNLPGRLVSNVRGARRGKGDYRVVLDLDQRLKSDVFTLPPSTGKGYRLVIDVFTLSGNKRLPARKLSRSKRDILVVIDPGHGGRDPGAIGANGLTEKSVVLRIAKSLAKRINDQKGFSARLTRTSDYYLPLRKRSEIARKQGADLLVSIHADAFKNNRANGASVFALSLSGASNEAALWLAERENAADLMGGVTLGDKDADLASVLLDLSSTASLQASLTVGDFVLDGLGGVARLHKSQVQQAGFVVLKSPDVQSILVETGFITNPAEARRLNTKKYRTKIAKAIEAGIVKYFREHPPMYANRTSGRHAML